MSLRIAFLTPDFVTEPDGSGPATYLHRMTAALLEAGHVPEIFTRTAGPSEVVDFNGIRVSRVAVAPSRLLAALVRSCRGSQLLDCTEAIQDITGAVALASALKKREQEVTFDLVQCSDWGVTGLFVSRSFGRPVLVRCCWSRDLFSIAERRWPNIGNYLLKHLERRAIRRADVAYAPSRFLADYMKQSHGINVSVVRPPLALESNPGKPPPNLPSRYLVHFGSMGYRKGTDLVARALAVAWREEPEITMVWAGAEHLHPIVEPSLQSFGERRNQVLWLGHLPKPELYAVVKGAVASVLPSRADNLPNTAIESLLLEVPVIGTLGCSLEEIVERGITGDLVPAEDVERLADLMVQFWRGRRVRHARSSVLAAMRPEHAVEQLLAAARMASSGSGAAYAARFNTSEPID